MKVESLSRKLENGYGICRRKKGIQIQIRCLFDIGSDTIEFSTENELKELVKIQIKLI